MENEHGRSAVPHRRPGVDWFVYVLGRAYYFAMEMVALFFGRSRYRQGVRAIGRSWHHYYRARALERRGDAQAAFIAAKNAFAALSNADPEETFAVLGEPIIILLDRLATKAKVPGGATSELATTLEVFTKMQADPERNPRAFDDVISWLRRRLHGLR